MTMEMGAEPDRPELDSPGVRALIAEIAPGAAATDLGGAYSLNALLEPAGLVLRVHQPDVSRRRLDAQQRVRQRLARHGVMVAEPIAWRGSTVLRCGSRWAEVERFIPHEMLPPALASYQWLFRAMGELHGVLETIDVPVPRPAFSTYGPLGTLLRWQAMTEEAVREDAAATAIARRARLLLGQLRRQWVPARELPNRIVHGDMKLRNIVRGMEGETVYLDFGFLAFRPRIHELGYAFTRMLLTLGVGETPDAPDAFDWGHVPELVAVYENAAAARLNHRERQALAPCIAASSLFQSAMCGFLPDAAGALRDDERRRLMTIAEWVLEYPDLIRGGFSASR